MRFTGTVHGDAAEKYGEFCYREPIMEEVTSFSIDPMRLHPMYEFPRYTDKPELQQFRTTSLADYSINIGDFDAQMRRTVSVFMEPSDRTTRASEPSLVYECSCKSLNIDDIKSHVLREVFR